MIELDEEVMEIDYASDSETLLLCDVKLEQTLTDREERRHDEGFAEFLANSRF